MKDYVPYLTVHLLVAVCYSINYGKSHKDKTEKESIISGRVVLVLGYLIYILFSVYRLIDYHTGGYDAIAYKSIFEYAKEYTLLEYIRLRKEEILYTSFAWGLRQVTSDFRWLLFIMHSVIYWCIGKYFAESHYRIKNPLKLVYIFLVSSFLFSSFNTMRFAVALSISLLFYNKILSKDYKRSVFLLCIAIGFHNACFILIPVLLLSIYRDKKNICSVYGLIVAVITIFVLELIVVYGAKSIISNSSYSSYDSSKGIAVFAYLAFTIVLVLMCISKYEYLDDDKQLNTNYIFIICAVFCIPIQLQYSVAYRMVTLFLPCLYGNICGISESKKFKLYNSAVNLPIQVFANFYLIYKCIDVYTNDFMAGGLYPYVSNLDYVNVFLSIT